MLSYQCPSEIGGLEELLPWFALMLVAICAVGAGLGLFGRHVVGVEPPHSGTGVVIDGAWSGSGQTCWYLFEVDQGGILLLRLFENCCAPLEVGERVTLDYRGTTIQRYEREP